MRFPFQNRFGGRLALSVALVALAGCGGLLETPPVEVGHRPSMVGAGQVVRVTSTSNEPLVEVFVEITNPSGGKRAYRHDQLDGYAGFEVGWKKLGGWQIELGATVEVRAKGYFRAYKARLAEEEE